ncbi:hypothetical protein KFE25_005169 [Diacronema lutheri]|uniref:Uncharacterized protein n=1 Tax=Diacronema lutheri TaxID=2081491 RepID=A0A8J5X8E5_DIALT|nr:hypothetical protein KFE25_005169 [Diacronema lutheri]
MDSGDDFMKTGRAATRTLAHDAGEPALRVQLSPGQNGAPDHYLTTRSYLAEVCAAKGAQFPNESIELDVFVLLKLVDGEIVGRLVIKFNILSSSHKKGSFRLLVCPANPVIRSKYPFFYGVTPPFSTTVKKLRTKAAKREALLEELSSVDAEGLAATNPRAQKL